VFAFAIVGAYLFLHVTSLATEANPTLRQASSLRLGRVHPGRSHIGEGQIARSATLVSALTAASELMHPTPAPTILMPDSPTKTLRHDRRDAKPALGRPDWAEACQGRR